MKKLQLNYFALFILFTVSVNAQNTFPSSGSVGIGTTNPAKQLEIKGGNGVGIRLLNDQANAWDILNTTNGKLDFIRGGANTFMRINQNGLVGIGATSPTHELTVEGDSSPNIELKNSNYSNGGFILNRENYGHQWKWWSESNTMYFGFSTDETNYSNKFTVKSNGNVGIGTTNPSEKLTVDGKILCEEVEVVMDINAPDYVFEKYYDGYSNLKAEYVMPTLEDIESFTKANHHLPEVPSAATLKADGLQLKEMSMILLQKIEELTLYTIEQEKRIKTLEAQINK